MANNNPSIDPANNGSLTGTLQFVFKKLLQSNVSGRLPAQLISYDRTTNRAQVKILISIVTTNGEYVSRQQLASLPVEIPGGGGFVLSFPLKTGDLGWVCACDRDISLFLQYYREAPPNTARMFSFSDAVFVPDTMKGFTISEEDVDSVTLQSLDGSVKLSVSLEKIIIKAPIIELQGDVTVTGELTAEAGVTVTGDVRVVGNITASGDITPHVP